MVISFDLDDTLIARNKFRLEKTSLFRQFFGIERLREGTIDLFKEVKKRKYKIYIYTTSHRSIWRIRWIFFSYGIPVDFVINQQKHQKEIKRHNINCSKFPPMYNIDLHIDDSVGVEMEGKKYGFKTIIISEKDENWVATILTNLK
jgi:hypothetical protein